LAFFGESWALHRLRLGLDGRNRTAQTISPALRAFLAGQILWASRPFAFAAAAKSGATRPSIALRITDKAAMGATLNHPKGVLNHG
jgi:hypothetical protein